MVIFIVVWVYLYFRKSEQKVNGSIVDTIFSIFCLFKPIKRREKVNGLIYDDIFLAFSVLFVPQKREQRK